MDASLIFTGAMTLLKPILEKAGERAAETIGEKLATKAIEETFWQKVKGLFVEEIEQNTIEAIENRPTATAQEVALIETKLKNAIKTNPQFAADTQAAMPISSNDMFVAEQLLKSIEADKQKLKQLFEDKGLAGIETEDQYELMIKKTRRRMQKDEQEFLKLIQK